MAAAAVTLDGVSCMALEATATHLLVAVSGTDARLCDGENISRGALDGALWLRVEDRRVRRRTQRRLEAAMESQERLMITADSSGLRVLAAASEEGVLECFCFHLNIGETVSGDELLSLRS